MSDTSSQSPLLPEQHPTEDFFVCDILDAAPKADMASMEHPVFSLSTKPETRTRSYQHGDKFIEIKPSADGLATIHDRDILIYCISQLMAAIRKNEQISQVVRFKAYDLLKATNRKTNGQAYQGLKQAFERLSGTRISTNIVTGDREEFETFGIIERARIVRETRDGRMQEVEVKLSDWVFNAIRHNEVLTLNRDYFRLRKPIERRMYEIARKHCGQQSQWKISLKLLQKKCGSASTLKEFRRIVGNIIEVDKQHCHFPDYAVELSEDDFVMFRNRGSVNNEKNGALAFEGMLKTETYETARLVAPGLDIYQLEQDWRAYFDKPPHNPDAAFIGFCRKRFEQNCC